MSLNSGVRVGPYEILVPIGAGGMGEVYRAQDPRLGRDVALKVLSTDLAASGEHLRRFEQEARAASALNHPNIITIYDIGRSGSMSYIAMELIDGRDVRSMLAGEQIPLKQALRIAVKVADGLAAAHERGIVHRDLKPENVMVTREGFVKILDFGLAKLVRPFSDQDSTLPHTTPGAVFGTVGYMSPEQAAGRAVDFRSDQFALGVILYEMLTGRLPFSAPTGAETLAAIIRTDPPPIAKYNEAVPPEVTRLIERLLAKDPGDRYASTRDLSRDLRELRDRLTNSSQPRHRSDRPMPLPPRRLAWIAGAAAGAILLVAGVIMTVRHTGGEAADRGARSVVVMPFRDLTGTVDGQIYSDGLAEMISSRLVQSRTVRVIPRFTETARGADPIEMARELGAAFALRAAVQRLGTAVNVSYALIDAGTGEQVAGETVEAANGDVLTLQEKLVSSILAAMNMTAGPRDAYSTPGELSSTADQNAYVQTLGLLQRSKNEKSVDDAIATLNRLLVNARDSAAVNAQLARALIYKSQLSRNPSLIAQAKVYAERARDIDNNLPDIHIRLGQIRNLTGRHAEALAEFERALALRPEDPDAIVGIALTKDAMGRAGEAETAYKKAIAARPDHANGYNLYGSFLYTRGRYGEAVANFRRFTQLMPDASRGFLNLGAAYQSLGRYDDARRAYERSIAIEPTGDAWSNIGGIEFYRGRYAEAVRANEKAAALTPTNFLVWANLADSYRWAPGTREKSFATYDKAVAMAREVLRVNPRDALTNAVMATSLAKAGHLAEAAAAIDAALKLDPTNGTVLYCAAVVDLLRGSAETSMTWLQRAVDAGYPSGDVQRDPEFASVREDSKFKSAVQAGK